MDFKPQFAVYFFSYNPSGSYLSATANHITRQGPIKKNTDTDP